MKAVMEEIRCIKNDYGDKIPQHLRQRLDKFSLIFKEIGKTAVLKSDWNPCIKMYENIEHELVVLRRQIQGEMKLSETDFSSFLWKLNTIKREPIPPFFSFLKLSGDKEQIQADKASTNFNLPILQMKKKDLIKLGASLCIQNQFCKENYGQKFMENIIRTISMRYNIIAYHNFTHAFSVFLMFYQCVHSSPIFKQMFTEFQFFIAYIAALCHDMNHRGTNSTYQIKKKTNLALRYNNQSVLENMHVSQFYRMNKENPDIDIIAKIKSPAQKVCAKRLLNHLILSTDIMSHTKSLNKLKVLKGRILQGYSETEKQVILQNIFHACDIGNPVLEFDNYINWSVLLVYEFNTQAELQKAEGFDVTPNFSYKGQKSHYQGQIGFIDFLAYPVWKQISIFFPQLSILAKTMAINKQKLQKLIAEMD